MDFDQDEILRTYLAEADEQLARMEECLVALESASSDPELLETIFRAAHTLKGNAASLGYADVAELAHAMEDVLHGFRGRTVAPSGATVTLLLRGVDLLRDLVSESVRGIEFEPAARAELVGLLQAAARAEDAPSKGSRSSGNSGGAGPASAVENLPEPPAAGGRPGGTGGGAPASPAAEAPAAARHRTLRVDVDRLDRILNLSGELAIARERSRQMLEVRRPIDELIEAHHVTDGLFAGLQEQIMKMRMVPVGPMFRQHVRTVRDVAQASGKQARLLIEGGDVEVDTSVIEHLRDPLTHMIRNAVDHGIEPPALRRERGKDPVGRIILRAFHDAGNIAVELHDDGCGLDPERILAKARSRGLVSDGHLSEDEIYRLIFEPGFSTAEAVTKLSGRGVGMDVVRRNIDALRGTIAIDNRPGLGLAFSIQLPLTLAVIDGFSVGIGEETYVIPLDAVHGCLDLPDEDQHGAGAAGVINLRGDALPYLRLRSVFGLERTGMGGRERAVVVKYHGGQAAFVVDELYGESQAVIKPLGKMFRHFPGIAGSTILGNGRVALILDVPALLRGVMARAAHLGAAPTG